MAKQNGIVERPDGAIIIKACGGDRSKNLEAIADEIYALLGGDFEYENGVSLSQRDVHRIKGYTEQLRIIADELK
jgi:hypothetical protein